MQFSHFSVRQILDLASHRKFVTRLSLPHSPHTPSGEKVCASLVNRHILFSPECLCVLLRLDDGIDETKFENLPRMDLAITLRHHETPLRAALCGGDPNISPFLLERGADIESRARQGRSVANRLQLQI